MSNRAVGAAVAAALITSSALPGAAGASDTPPPSIVTIAGSLQSEFGCLDDWDPECTATQLGYIAEGDAWVGTFDVPAGDWEYKAALDGTWDENYGRNGVSNGDNITLSVAESTMVTFFYSHGSHWITDDVTSRIVTAPGDFQSELGCAGDWDPGCLRSWLQDVDGDGTYTLATDAIPAGAYAGKAAIDRTWDENYGAGGVAGGTDIGFTVAEGDTVTFSFVSATNVLTITAEGQGGNTDIEPGDELLVTAPSRPLSDESVYFVMTDRFANGDPGNDTAGLAGDKFVHGFDATDKGFHHGGDLAGLTAQLDYIAGLGVSSIWITPPFTNDYVQLAGGPGTASSSYHGYWQTDFTQIDPHYGTNAEMVAFVDAAHAQGIKVLFDVVLNHTGDVITYEEGTSTYRNKTDFPYRDAAGVEFDDRAFEGTGTFPELDPATSFPYTPTFATTDDEAAKAPAWLNDPRYYHNRGNSTFAGENSQYGDFFGLDDLFSEHPDVVDGMVDIHTSMIDTFGVDGFRVDTVKHVSDGFWEAWVPAVMDHAAAAGKADFVMFGEVFGETVEFRSRYSTELDFPGTLDFGFNGAARRFAAANAPAAEVAAYFETDDWYTDTDSNAHDLAKFIGNHDEGRFALEVRNDNPGASDGELVSRIALGQALNFLTRGRPVVYYGDEQGFVGDGGDQDARQDMFPSQVASYNDDDLIGTDATTADSNFDATHPLYQAIGDVATLRGAHPALQTGAQITRFASSGAGVFAFSRIDGTEQVEYVVALNNSEAAAGATFATDTSGASWTAVWPAGGATASSDADGNLTVDVPALGFVVYRADSSIDQPGVTAIAMAGPTAGSEVVGRVAVGAQTSGGYGEVTFAVSVDGGAYEVLGVDDNAPYRLYHDVSAYAPGTALTYKAIVKNANGHLASDKVSVVVGEEAPPPPPGSGPEYAIVHYQRADGDPTTDDYGDHTTGDSNDMWGLHLWGEAIDPAEVTDWTSPKPFLGEDEYGRFAWIKLADVTKPLNFIVHRGDVKDGTDADRLFEPGANPEVWLKQDDAGVYTSQAAAQGFVTIHYQRPDGDYTDWGLHLWGDAIEPGEVTDWAAPKLPTGVDDYGAFWNVAVQDVTLPVNFIVHRGDEKDPGPDQAMIPADDASIWLQSGDTTIYGARGAAEDYATIRYHRPDGDYGDYTSDDFTQFWGLHVWAGAAAPNPAWQQPVKPTGFDLFGPYWEIALQDGAPELAYIIHRGETKDPGPDQFLTFATYDHEVWQLQGADPESPYILPVPAGGAVSAGDLTEERAHWVDADTIVWPAATDGSLDYALCHSPTGGLALDDAGITGGDCLPLTPAGTFPAGVDGWLHLGGLPMLELAAGDVPLVPAILRGQVAVEATAGGVGADATGLQIPGVLDDLFATDAELGVVWDGATPSIRLWAPTATSVTLQVFDDSTTTTATEVAMTQDGGVWTASGDGAWDGKYYLFEVEVYVPSTGQVETNTVTDPYSVSLSTNSTRSQIVDLADPALMPDAWNETAKPDLARPEDVSIYELHVRDFSITDETVPAEQRGTFAAFTHDDSDGMEHLAELAEAGVSFVHLLPAFDIATVNEDASQRQEPDAALLATYPPDSDQQQAAVAATATTDGFNWGYDPLHYTAPEGSYSTDPDGPQRVVEFREMVQSLNDAGLRVVMDVVYNHTHAAGQDPQSVLDRIVPGYYQRLNDVGAVETSTCCANTATEHEMMGKLMIDSVVTWAKQYQVDGFRFDLMGHHSKQNLLDLRAALDALTVEADGVDGSSIYLYGEGWNFGEVADDARFVQATQLNMGGTGIGTFSDRLRDAVRGGGPFDGGQDLVTNQGFVNGLWYDTNGGLAEADALTRLLLAGDQIRVGLAGNLADFEFVDRTGTLVTGSQVDYNGSPAGYTADPQENIVYVEAHDNQTLFDIGQYHHPLDATMAERVRAQNVANAIVALSQGVPFLHAGQDLLRSKSMDRNSYDSGDWFNQLDWSLQSNNWGVGLPPAPDNQDNWSLIQPRLAAPALAPAPADIERNAEVTREWFEIRSGSPLFRLETADEIQQRLTFGNTGPAQTPGLIVMSLDDAVAGLADLDAEYEGMHVLFNATDEAITYTDASLTGAAIELHPVLTDSVDPVVRTAAFDAASGSFEVPARTTAVFVNLGPDVTPPTATAELHRVLRLGNDAGIFLVEARCTDDRGTVTTEADVNGVPVDHGDVAVLVQQRRPHSVSGPGIAFIWAPSFELTVTCTDAAGNTTVATAVPRFRR